MMSMMEYVRRTDETIVEGKIDVYFQDAELFGELVDRAEYQRRLAVELAPRTDAAVGRFINSRGQSLPNP